MDLKLIDIAVFHFCFKGIRGTDFIKESGGNLDLHKAEGWVSHWDKAGHEVEWIIDVMTEGEYELVLRFASEVPSVREIAINGKPVAGLEEVKLKATGGWRLWEMASFDIPLQLSKGEHTLRITNINNSLNIRQIILVPVVSGKVVDSRWIDNKAGNRH